MSSLAGKNYRSPVRAPKNRDPISPALVAELRARDPEYRGTAEVELGEQPGWEDDDALAQILAETKGPKRIELHRTHCSCHYGARYLLIHADGRREVEHHLSTLANCPAPEWLAP